MVIPVILSGGAGTRLWPLSRKSLPKQHLKIFDGESLFSKTLKRVVNYKGIQSIVVVSDQDSRFLIQDEINEQNLKQDIVHLIEPVSRNTAPAIALAAFEISKRYGETAMMLVLPADHLIANPKGFHDAIENSIIAVNENAIVTWGMTPKWPETGYGYIKKSNTTIGNVFKVSEFKEKPNYEVAQSYLESQEYLWNSGIFFMKANVFLHELKKTCPTIYSSVELAHKTLTEDLNFNILNKDLYQACPSDSIDYAVMEKTKEACVLPVDIGWSDVGSWASAWANLSQDENGNVILGNIKVVDCKNSLFIGTQKHLSLAVGLNECCYIQTEDVSMILPKSKSQELKKYLADTLDKDAKEQERLLSHRRVYRPWGFYESFDVETGYQIKKILVKPKAKLSLQSHNHRSEHWVVIKGTATVTKGDKVFDLREGESTYIEKLEKHRLENRSGEPVEIIEVQIGHYLGEDDIVRYEDVYGRSN